MRSLQAIARRHQHSVEYEARELAEAHFDERQSVLEQVEAAWDRQSRRPTAEEIDSWVLMGRR